MADWKVTIPSKTPKFWNHGSGVYSRNQIFENGVEKEDTPAASRIGYLPAQGPQNFGSCDATEESQNEKTNTKMHQNAISYCDAEMIAKWDYLAPGTTTTRPKYTLDWSIENKVSAPNQNQLTSKATGAIVGTIDHSFARINPQAGTTYSLPIWCKLQATYIRDDDATLDASVLGYMKLVCQNSKVEAKYDPVANQWVIDRNTRQSDGTYLVTQYTHPGKTFSRAISFYEATTGGAPLFCAAVCGSGKQPWSGDDWQDQDDSIAMVSDAGHVTGMDPARDDVWEGEIWFQPRVDIEA